jgi:hypothetical protein
MEIEILVEIERKTQRLRRRQGVHSEFVLVVSTWVIV